MSALVAATGLAAGYRPGDPALTDVTFSAEAGVSSVPSAWKTN